MRDTFSRLARAYRGRRARINVKERNAALAARGTGTNTLRHRASVSILSLTVLCNHVVCNVQ
jgi:hypothetical protein